jgi:hypothetical protein
MNAEQKEGTDFVVKAAAEREGAVTEDVVGLHWQGVRLQAWSAKRELLFLVLQERLHAGPLGPALNKIEQLSLVETRMAALIAEAKIEVTAVEPGGSAVSVPAEISLEGLIDWTRFEPDAGIVLWLASHEAHEILSRTADLERWLGEIDGWAERWIAADELIPAVRLAHRLRLAHRQLITLPRPDATSRKRDAGN